MRSATKPATKPATGFPRACLAASLALALAAGLVSCGDPKPRLRVLSSDGRFDPELVRRFELEHGCRVAIDTFDSGEDMLAKLRSGSRGHDVLVAEAGLVPSLARDGKLLELDRSLLTNLGHVDRGFLDAIAVDAEMRHSVPHTMSPAAIAWIDGGVDDPLESWDMFRREELKGRATMLDDPRETVGAALKALGYSLNTLDDAELEAARDLVVEWRRLLARFDGDRHPAGLSSEELLLVHGHAGDLFRAREGNARVRIAVPQEGTSLACDALAVPEGAPLPGLAHAFIDFLLDPEVAAGNMGYARRLAPNTGAYELLDEAILVEPAIFVDPDILVRSEIVRDLGPEGEAKYARIWGEILEAAER